MKKLHVQLLFGVHFIFLIQYSALDGTTIFPHESVSCFFIDVIFMNHLQSSNKTRLFAGKSINGKRDSGANIHLSGMNDLSEEVFVDEYNETQGLTR